MLRHCVALYGTHHGMHTPVIKPIYGAASIGVVRVNSLEDLEKTYLRVQKEMSGARIVAGALTQGDEAEGEVRTAACPCTGLESSALLGGLSGCRCVHRRLMQARPAVG